MRTLRFSCSFDMGLAHRCSKTSGFARYRSWPGKLPAPGPLRQLQGYRLLENFPRMVPPVDSRAGTAPRPHPRHTPPISSPGQSVRESTGPPRAFCSYFPPPNRPTPRPTPYSIRLSGFQESNYNNDSPHSASSRNSTWTSGTKAAAALSSLVSFTRARASANPSPVASFIPSQAVAIARANVPSS